MACGGGGGRISMDLYGPDKAAGRAPMMDMDALMQSEAPWLWGWGGGW